MRVTILTFLVLATLSMTREAAAEDAPSAVIPSIVREVPFAAAVPVIPQYASEPLPDVASEQSFERVMQGDTPPATVDTSLAYDPPSSEDEPVSPSDIHPESSFESVCGECLHPSTCHWYGSVEALFLMRGGPGGGRALVIDTVDQNLNYPGPTRITAGDAGVGVQIGPQVTIGRRRGDVGWEATYFGVFGADGSQSVTGDNSLAIPGALGLVSLDFFASDLMTVTTSGELHSVEFNRVSHLDCWSVLYGVRYLRLNESLNIRAGDPDTSGSDYRVSALNNLFGAQVGLRRAGQVRRLGWDLSAKAGLYGNAASQNQYVTDFPHPNPTFYLREPVGADEAALSFVGELNLGLHYALTDRVSARVGYKVLWIEGVATAVDQLDFDYPGTSSLGVTTHGGTYLHGASAGLEARW